MNMFEFPEIPSSKLYGDEQLTPEQIATFKLVQYQKLDKADEDALIEAIAFYETAFTYLKSINLGKISEEEKNEIVAYLEKVLNLRLIIQNNISFKNVFRVSFVRESFLEHGKVVNASFLYQPPLEIIEKVGKYGRANSDKSTCLYCSFNPAIALLETKPSIGERIIISKWEKVDELPFVTYPIVNNYDVPNEGVKKATMAFKERMTYNNPLFANILSQIFGFIGSEFVKSIPIVNPKAYEYLFSAFFADKIINIDVEHKPHPTEPINNYDCIIYPSIAANHLSDNLAIKPNSVDRLKLVYLEDCIVQTTNYENPIIYENELPDIINLPIGRRVLRKSNQINDNRILWSDD